MNNKIWAKLYLNPEKYDAKGLVRAFFGRIDFNSKNSLVIRGEEAKVEIIFEEHPPMDIIEAISNCKIMELNFGKELEEYKTNSTPEKAEEEEAPQIETTPAEAEEAETPHTDTAPVEAEEVEAHQPEAESAEVEEEEIPQPEAELAEVEEEEEPQNEPAPKEAEEVDTPQIKTAPAEAEEPETPQLEAESAEVEEEKTLQPEAESEEVEEEEIPQLEAESEEVEEEKIPQPEAESAEVEEKEEPQNEPARNEAEEKTPQTETELEHKPETKRRGGRRTVSSEPVDIPELKEIAGKATSFKHFVKLVAEWMDMRRQREFFEELLLVTAEVNMVAWKELENALKLKKVFFTSSDRIAVSNKVTKSFRKYNVTLMPFLATVAQYKSYSFGNESTEVSSHVEEEENCVEFVPVVPLEELYKAPAPIEGNAEISDEPTQDEEETFGEVANPTPAKVKMQCIPEIRSFEETLSSVDKTQPIEERVKHVLIGMGWDKKDEKSKKLIFEIINAAIRVKEMSFENTLKKANISVTDNLNARMHVSKLINEFVRKHYPAQKPVSVMDFIQELQEIVMFESEIE